jgi:hypothetical protein
MATFGSGNQRRARTVHTTDAREYQPDVEQLPLIGDTVELTKST